MSCGGGVPVALQVRMTSLPTCRLTSRVMVTMDGGTAFKTIHESSFTNTDKTTYKFLEYSHVQENANQENSALAHYAYLLIV